MVAEDAEAAKALEKALEKAPEKLEEVQRNGRRANG
jgi:hypothetical protein